jgi:hypothetical protein
MDNATGWIMRIVVSYYQCPTEDETLTLYSLVLLYFTLSMVYTTWDERRMEEPLRLRRHICYLHHSLTYLSYRSMPSLLW